MGPLCGLKVIEIAAMGPAPFCAMMLGDMGADVLRIDRPPQVTAGNAEQARFQVLHRNRRSVCIDLKSSEGIAAAIRLVATADVLVEGFRPGVMERLGLGPDTCLAHNPRLVYGRMTGWGQDGPLAQAAGHDINYIALTGALHAIGERDRPPVPPLNIIGDFGGGGAILATGILAALWETGRSGRGQVVDAAMLDGSALLMSWIYGEFAAGRWRDRRSSNEVDGGRPFYQVYETADGKFIAVGPIEPRFFAELCRHIGLDDRALADHHDHAAWPALQKRLAAIFRTRSRAQWCALLEGSDACVTPVLSLAETPEHAHNRARGVFIEVDGVVQPAPAPRFSRSLAGAPTPPPAAGTHTAAALADWGFRTDEIDALRASRAIA